MRRNFTLLFLLLNCLISHGQTIKTLEKEISQIVKNYVPYAKSVSINNDGEFIIHEKINDDDATEIVFNLKDIEIAGIEESLQDGYGKPIGKYRILLSCNSGECVSTKKFIIKDGKKLFKKMWKNDQAWFYLNDYDQAVILEKKLKKSKNIIR